MELCVNSMDSYMILRSSMERDKLNSSVLGCQFSVPTYFAPELAQDVARATTIRLYPSVTVSMLQMSRHSVIKGRPNLEAVHLNQPILPQVLTIMLQPLARLALLLLLWFFASSVFDNTVSVGSIKQSFLDFTRNAINY